MAQKLNPFSGRQFLDENGDPYSGAKLFIYAAGSSTKSATTKDSAGLSSHANPIVLNSRGEPADGAGASQAIWQSEGTPIKMVLAPSTDTDPPVSAISTWDNISGINDTTVTIGQWVSGPAPTYISATSFTLVGDQTTEFHVGRRLKTSNTSGSIYSTITAVAYTSLTTVTVVNDSGSLDSGLSAVSYGILTATNYSLPIISPFRSSQTATTSGTSHDFTGIPPWVKRVTVVLNAVSTTGTSPIEVRIGDGAIVSTGYSSAGALTNASTAIQTTNTGFAIYYDNTGFSLSGTLTITNISGNVWVASGAGLGDFSTAFVWTSGGIVSLSGELDRVRLTTVAGTDTFDNGAINILYE